MLIRVAEHMEPVRALTVPHQGTVVDNLDPNKLGRVKCTIPGIMEAAKENLPWITTEQDPSNMIIPEIGDVLKIEFPNNDVYTPVYVGYWNTKANLNPDFDADYPNTFGIVKQGFKLLYNMTQKLAQLIHPSGTEGDIDMDGNVTTNIAKDHTHSVVGSVFETIDGDEVRVIGGNTDDDITGNVLKTIGGNVTKTVAGNESKTIDGDYIRTAANHVIDSPGNIQIGSPGATENLVLGIQFQTLYNAHTHIGNLGIPTGVPILPMTAAQLASKVFTEA